MESLGLCTNVDRGWKPFARHFGSSVSTKYLGAVNCCSVSPYTVLGAGKFDQPMRTVCMDFGEKRIWFGTTTRWYRRIKQVSVLHPGSKKWSGHRGNKTRERDRERDREIENKNRETIGTKKTLTRSKDI